MYSVILAFLFWEAFHIQRKKADPRNRNQENVADEIEYKELQICVNG